MSKTVVVSALFLAGSVLAQPPAQPPAPPPAPAPGQPAPRPVIKQATGATAQPAPNSVAKPKTIPAWSDPDFARVGKMLVGTWKTTAPVAQRDASATTDIVLNIVQVPSLELKDIMYVEGARLDSLHAPYRHAIFQLYKFKGKTRLRTYEFTGPEFDPDSLTGLWSAPEFFPDIKRSNLIATLDVELAPGGSGFSGKSPYPYPTGVAGAVEMTSEVTLTGDSFTSADRGYDADGKIVWGSSEKDKYTFARFTPPVKVTKKENGLVLIEYKKPSADKAVENNDRVSVHFTGWLTNGIKWDTSRGRPQPAVFQVGGSPMAGLNEGLVGTTKGTIMRMYLPAPLAFGEKGYRTIPPNEDVILDLEVMGVDTPPPPVTPTGAAGTPQSQVPPTPQQPIPTAGDPKK